MNTIVHSLFDWYQSRIGSLDKQSWEKYLDSQTVKHNLYCIPEKSSKIDDLIDIDLIKGSSFPKFKSKLSLSNILFNGIIKLLFFPCYFKWWKKQIGCKFSYLILIVYIMQLVNVVILNSAFNTKSNDEQIFDSTDISMPLITMVILGVIYSYISSSLSGQDSENHYKKSEFEEFRNTRTRCQSLVPVDNAKNENQEKTQVQTKKVDKNTPKKKSKILKKDVKCFSDSKTSIKSRKNILSLNLSAKKEQTDKTLKSSRIVNLNEFNFENFGLLNHQTTTDSSSFSSSSNKAEFEYVDENANRVPENSLNSDLNHASIQDENYIYEYQNDDYVAFDDDDDDEDDEETNVEALENEITRSTEDTDEPFETSKLDIHSLDITLGEKEKNDKCSINNNNLKDNTELYKISQKIVNSSAVKDKIFCLIWQFNEWKGADLSMLEISNMVIGNVEKHPLSHDYFYVGLILSLLISFLPIIYHSNHKIKIDLNDSILNQTIYIDEMLSRFVPSRYFSPVIVIIEFILNIKTVKIQMIYIKNYFNYWTSLNLWCAFVFFNTFLSTFILLTLFFTLLTVAERTLSQRLLHAKYFCYLTSNRRSRKNNVPHFRLNKVENIKTWLSVRSYMKRRGPQRSIDAIISSTFLIGVSLCSAVCIRFLQNSDFLTESLSDWQLVLSCLCIWAYMLRFMTIGHKINKKYRNCMSMVITEQINLYLEMEKKPEKKDKLIVVNNVLKLAADLLKEIENPFKISGLGVNTWVYNVTKVVILSAASAVLIKKLTQQKGTLWCGIGNDASNCTEIGKIKETDTCCRMHDICPYKYNINKREHNGYEWSWRRIYTLTHCECDLMFQNCLAQEPIHVNSAKIWHSFRKLGVKCYSFFPCKNDLFENFWSNLEDREIGSCVEDVRVVVFESVDDYSNFVTNNLNKTGLAEEQKILSSYFDRFYVAKTKIDKYSACLDEIFSYKTTIVNNFGKLHGLNGSPEAMRERVDLTKKLEEVYQNELVNSKKSYLASKARDFLMKIFSILT
ncbi:homeodomain transcription factor [Brachionus plicatilis]|uniref:Homeodomain transcription factor n=1 Tax=Brachionus plicatilis TaxID=10195 RepID=A0A3M7QXR4_BRAPC|nr:homeodomain transcription factor [Brachionus plicatilis]